MSAALDPVGSQRAAGTATRPGAADAPGSRATNILELRDVHARIGGQQVIEGVSLDVPAVGVTALLGRNGVGKSSTLKSILGLIDRTGSITFMDAPIQKLRTHRIVQRGIGYVPEDREVFGTLTVLENLRLAERTVQSNYALVDELFPDLVQRRGQRAGSLSGGQQQMVSLARVLLNDNNLLLIDEPTKGLAPKIVTEVTAALGKVAETTPMLLVEQNLQVARELADRVIVLSDGHVAFTGTADEFFGNEQLIQRHLGVATSGEAH